MSNKTHNVPKNTSEREIVKLAVPVVVAIAAAFGKYLLHKHPKTSKRIKDIFDSDSLITRVTKAVITGKDSSK